MASGLFADEEDDFDVAAEVDAAAPMAAAADVDLSPRNNPHFLGHESVEKSLLMDFNARRMPHAIILAGPAGIGKATLAYRLARFLLSREESGSGLFGDVAPPISLQVAPEHPVFRRVASGGHADLLTVERELDEKKGRLKNDIAVDAVRKVHPFLRKTAAEGGWRVVIVDGAEYLNHNGQNALLKILEEPPSKTVLILTTSQPGAFLPTIRSRCRMVTMEPLAENIVGTLIEQHVPGILSAEKAALSRLSEGSIGKALRFHEEDGVALYKNLLTVVSLLPELDTIAVHDLAEKITRSGVEQSYFTATEILTGWCERLARLQARGQPVTDILQGDAEIFTRLQQLYPPRHFLNAWEKMAQLFRQVDSYNLDKRQALISAFLMLQRPDYQGLNL